MLPAELPRGAPQGETNYQLKASVAVPTGVLAGVLGSLAGIGAPPSSSPIPCPLLFPVLSSACMRRRRLIMSAAAAAAAASGGGLVMIPALKFFTPLSQHVINAPTRAHAIFCLTHTRTPHAMTKLKRSTLRCREPCVVQFSLARPCAMGKNAGSCADDSS